jgi:hypothetical protein
MATMKIASAQIRRRLVPLAGAGTAGRSPLGRGFLPLAMKHYYLTDYSSSTPTSFFNGLR